MERIININGEQHTINEWAVISGINSKTIRTRLFLGKDGTDLIKPTMKKADYSYLIGKIFGKLQVLNIEPKKYRIQIHAECKCSCGNKTSVIIYGLLSGKTRSCGCLKSETAKKVFATHNMSKSREWKTWTGMKSRCLNKDSKYYHLYGGRGIKVCDRWIESFENFYEDMGDRPSSKHSLDRIDVNGNYELANCRWATWRVQANNKTDNRIVEYLGFKLTVAEWSRVTKIDRYVIYRRLDAGWSLEESLTVIPVLGQEAKKRKNRISLTPTIIAEYLGHTAEEKRLNQDGLFC